MITDISLSNILIFDQLIYRAQYVWFFFPFPVSRGQSQLHESMLLTSTKYPVLRTKGQIFSGGGRFDESQL